MNCEEALEYIHSLRWMSKKLGLIKTRQILKLLGNPEKKMKYVHVAGTNGKGSTSAMTAEILRQSGLKVGLFTSPFIMRFNERIMVSTDGEGDSLRGFMEIPDDDLARLTGIVKEKIDLMEEPPSEFEAVTAIGFLYFLEQKCDIVVLEVGMGGEADSTNVIPAPLVTVMVNIGLDHMQYLGNTITEIARTKSGVIKKGSEVVFYGENDEALAVISERCKKTGCTLHVPDFSLLKTRKNGLSGQTFDYGDHKNIKLSLLGKYQEKNAAVAVEAIEVLKNKGFDITEEDITKGLAATNWFARLEKLAEAPYVFVDGSHNPQGMRATVDAVKQAVKDEKKHFSDIICVFGVMADKDHHAIIEILSEIATEIVAVQPVYVRAMNCDDLFQEVSDICLPLGIKVSNGGSVPDGIRLAMKHADKDALVLCLGSLYMAGEVRDHFLKK